MTVQAGKPIVVGVDGSDVSEKAVRWAATEARRRNLPLKLLRSHEWSGGYPMYGVDVDAVRQESKRLLDVAQQTARDIANDVEPARAVSDHGPSSALLAESADASMIVVGCRGRGSFAGLVLGSTSLALAAHSRCPVVVLPMTWSEGNKTNRIVVGVDNSPASHAAVAFAMDEAVARQADLIAIHSWEVGHYVASWAPVPATVDWAPVLAAEHANFTSTMASWRTKNPDLRIELRSAEGHPIRVLADASTDADLMVVGARGRGAIAGLLLGSVSQGLLHESACPVAVVPQAR